MTTEPHTEPKPLRFSTLMGELMDEGLSKKSAEKLTESFEIVYEHQNATKGDLVFATAKLENQTKETEARLAAKITQTKNELEAKITQTKNELEAKIAQTKSDLEAKIAQTKSDLEAKIAETNRLIAETKADLIKWVIGAMIAQSGLIIGILGFLIKSS